MSKKLHAKDLRRDEVAEAVTHAADGALTVARSHQRPFVIGAIAVLVLGLAAIIVAWRVEASRSRAVAAYGEAARAWEKADGAALEGDEAKPSWDDVAAEMGQVADASPGTPSGRLARLQQGRALLRAFKPREAADVLGRFVEQNPRHWATPEALVALAAAREDAGDADGAEKALVELRDGSWRNWPKGGADMLLARFYERHGRADEARQLYEKIKDDADLEDSDWARQAAVRLEELGARSPQAASTP